MPSPTDEIFREVSKNLNIRCNFPNCIEYIDASTSDSIARRTPTANILTTNNTIPVLCNLLWMQTDNFLLWT
jgi:hypothetical protein